MPGSAWVDSLVEEANEMFGGHDSPSNDLSGVTVKVDGERLRASIRGARGSVVEDVLVPKDGNVHLTLDGHTYQLDHETMMEVLRKRAEYPKVDPPVQAHGPYRTAPYVVPALASAKARPSKWHCRWLHYAGRFARKHSVVTLAMGILTPFVGASLPLLPLAWMGRAIGGVMVAWLYVVAMGGLLLRRRIQARADRQTVLRPHAFGDLFSVLSKAVRVKPDPMLRGRKEKPDDPTPEPPVEIRDLVKLLREQGFDGERVEILRVPPASLTVAMAARLLRTFDHDSSRLKALEHLARNITDREHASVIVEAFDFGSSKVKALRMVREAQS